MIAITHEGRVEIERVLVIVTDDGRSNDANSEGRIVEEIRDRWRRLIWLNRETEHFWYTGDSEMRTYQAVCNEVRPCRNLDQLTTFIKDLVLSTSAYIQYIFR